jgi:hypothetical protein
MMRRFTKAILLILVALVYAGTAGAWTMSVGPGGTMSVLPSDVISLEVVVNSDGATSYGEEFYVVWDPTVLSPDPIGSTINVPTTGMAYGFAYFTYYSYLTPGMGAMFISNTTLGTPVVQNDVIGTLVFHVMDVPTSTSAVVQATFTDPVLTDYFLPIWLDGAAVAVPVGSIATPGTTIHVPEPTTTMLMGLGLLGILYAGRRR